MAQFDLYRNPNPDSRKRFPYLLDLQSDLLEGLATRVVAPLSAKVKHPITNLQPTLHYDGREWVLSTPELAGIAARGLGAPLGNLADQRPAIMAALDLLFTGI